MPTDDFSMLFAGQRRAYVAATGSRSGTTNPRLNDDLLFAPLVVIFQQNAAAWLQVERPLRRAGFHTMGLCLPMLKSSPEIR